MDNSKRYLNYIYYYPVCANIEQFLSSLSHMHTHTATLQVIVVYENVS